MEKTGRKDTDQQASGISLDVMSNVAYNALHDDWDTVNNKSQYRKTMRAVFLNAPRRVGGTDTM